MNNSKIHIKAVLQALFVTFLWSTSWVLIKTGLKGSLPAITFAGLRYSLAFLCLVPFVLINNKNRGALRGLKRSAWKELIILGIVFYAFTQGAQFLSLSLLPAASVSLFLNLTPVVVALSGSLIINEKLTARQWIGIILTAAGVMLYFLPLNIPEGQAFGIVVALLGLLANSASALLGRKANKSGLSPLIVTFVSMGIGAVLLMASGILFQGFGNLNLQQWVIIAWLALVNTAFAFWLWNHTLSVLTAVESSILNSTMLPQIALLAWILLDEPLSAKQLAGMALVSIGVLIVQLWRMRTPGSTEIKSSGEKENINRANGIKIKG